MIVFFLFYKNDGIRCLRLVYFYMEDFYLIIYVYMYVIAVISICNQLASVSSFSVSFFSIVNKHLPILKVLFLNS